MQLLRRFSYIYILYDHAELRHGHAHLSEARLSHQHVILRLHTVFQSLRHWVVQQEAWKSPLSKSRG